MHNFAFAMLYAPSFVILVCNDSIPNIWAIWQFTIKANAYISQFGKLVYCVFSIETRFKCSWIVHHTPAMLHQKYLIAFSFRFTCQLHAFAVVQDVFSLIVGWCCFRADFFTRAQLNGCLIKVYGNEGRTA